MLVGSLQGLAGDSQDSSSVPEQTAITVKDLDLASDGKNVTIKFTVREIRTGRTTICSGQAPAFIIEATSEQYGKHLSYGLKGSLPMY